MNQESINDQPAEEHQPPEAATEGSAEQIPAVSAEPGETGLPPAMAVTEPKPKTFVQKTLQWVLAVLLSLVIGFALALFLLYLPASSALNQTKVDLANTKGSLELAETKSADLQSSLSDTNTQLKTAKNDLDSAKINLTLARMQTNISYARLALINKDTLTARQELSDADANLANLTLLINDSETTSTLADRLKNIRSDLSSDPSKALEELRILSDNLDRLGNR